MFVQCEKDVVYCNPWNLFFKYFNFNTELIKGCTHNYVGCLKSELHYGF